MAKKLIVWDFWDKKKLVQAILDAKRDIMSRPEDFIDKWTEAAEYFLDELASGAAGIYQAQEVADFFNLELEDFLSKEEIEEIPEGTIEEAPWANYEFGWEIIEEVTEDIAEQMNKELGPFLAHHDAQLYFSHLEADGSYGLFVAFDKEAVGGWEESPLGQYAKRKQYKENRRRKGCS